LIGMAGLPTVVFDFAGVLFHWQPVQLLQTRPQG
jgi:hypothetical protein